MRVSLKKRRAVHWNNKILPNVPVLEALPAHSWLNAGRYWRGPSPSEVSISTEKVLMTENKSKTSTKVIRNNFQKKQTNLTLLHLRSVKVGLKLEVNKLENLTDSWNHCANAFPKLLLCVWIRDSHDWVRKTILHLAVAIATACYTLKRWEEPIFWQPSWMVPQSTTSHCRDNTNDAVFPCKRLLHSWLSLSISIRAIPSSTNL